MAYSPYVLCIALKKNVIKKEAIDQKIANQLKFKEEEQPEQEIDLTFDIMVFAEKIVGDRLPELYNLIH